MLNPFPKGEVSHQGTKGTKEIVDGFLVILACFV